MGRSGQRFVVAALAVLLGGACASAPAGEAPPLAPPRAEALSWEILQLTWEGPPGVLYEVHQGERSGGPYSRLFGSVETPAPGKYTFYVWALERGKSYYFVVRSPEGDLPELSARNDESRPDAEVESPETVPTPAPAAPSPIATPPAPAAPTLVKGRPWTVAELTEAVRTRVDEAALIDAIRKDKADLYVGDLDDLEAAGLEASRPLYVELLMHAKQGAGSWTWQQARSNVQELRKTVKPSVKPTATPELRRRSQAGEPAAMYELGRALEGTPEGTEGQALERRAAEAGYAPARWRLGDDLASVGKRDGVKTDDALAAVHFRASAEAGEPWGAFKLGAAFFWGHGVAGNYLEAERWLLESAARSGEDQGIAYDYLQKLYGLSFSTNSADPSDVRASARWARELLRRGGRPAQNVRETLATERTYVERALETLPPEVAPWAPEEVARLEAGDGEALATLGEGLATGYGAPQDDARAAGYLTRAAEKGSARAMARLGRMRRLGLGATKDTAAGLAWLEKAGAAGDASAWREVGDIYSGFDDAVKDDPRSPTKAAAAYEAAAALGDAMAMWRLANLARDPAKALALRTRAAEGGVGQARKELGELADEVLELEEAVRWYRQALASDDLPGWARKVVASRLAAVEAMPSPAPLERFLARRTRAMAQPAGPSMQAALGDLVTHFAALIAAGPTAEGRAGCAKQVSEARAKAAAGEYGAALDLLDTLCDELPTLPGPYLERATIQRTLRRYRPALVALELGALLSGPAEKGRLGRERQALVDEIVVASRLSEEAPLALALAVASARRSIVTDDSKAPDHVAEALRLDPRCAAALVLQARLKAARRDQTTLVADLEAACAADPRCAEALGTRAMIRLETSDPAGAEADVTAALALDPKNIEAQQVRVRQVFDGGDPAAIKRALDELVTLHPVPDAYTVRAQVALAGGDKAAAIVDFTAAAASDPFNPKLQLDCARALVKLGDVTAARGLVERAAKVGDWKARKALGEPPYAAPPGDQKR